MLVPNEFVAAALAVGLAIGVMHYLRCIHPPGGATAITPVIGGPAVHALGFQFVLTPVLLNVAIILLTAIGVNWFFRWRRYPAGLGRRKKPDAETDKKHLAEGSLSHSDLEYAMRQINSTLDITENDLARIFELAADHAKSARMEPWQVRLLHYYSNGRYGDDWQIRQVVDESQQVNPDKDLVIYKVLAGRDRRKSGVCTRTEFARWARYEVFQEANSWQRKRH
jgi:CBS domain-containing membrane protein